MAKITKFYFDRARYLIGDGTGRDLFMIVDYRRGNFRLVGSKVKRLREKAAVVARDLLSRKHGINFADKIGK